MLNTGDRAGECDLGEFKTRSIACAPQVNKHNKASHLLTRNVPRRNGGSQNHRKPFRVVLNAREWSLKLNRTGPTPSGQRADLMVSRKVILR
ncbi:hypothetical protein [Shimia thalassica]|uniref:hypothetical protein n=1 Tax=Shimia thalassica TaxID=1715693 RepID=UPI00273406D0|nr:hypothetical protein [Shimia thalassica]